MNVCKHETLASRNHKYIGQRTYGVIGIELLALEPREGVADGFEAPFLDLLSEEDCLAGVSSTSFRNWLLFMIVVVVAYS